MPPHAIAGLVRAFPGKQPRPPQPTQQNPARKRALRLLWPAQTSATTKTTTSTTKRRSSRRRRSGRPGEECLRPREPRRLVREPSYRAALVLPRTPVMPAGVPPFGPKRPSSRRAPPLWPREALAAVAAYGSRSRCDVVGAGASPSSESASKSRLCTASDPTSPVRPACRAGALPTELTAPGSRL
jgi:hypothetical protein